MADYSPPITNGAVYDRLVTQSPGNYGDVEPMLAESWDVMEDGARIRFHLRDDVRFWDGSPLTAADVEFSLHRLLNVRDQPAVYAANLERVEVVDEHTVDLIIKNPAEPIMINLAAPAFAIYSKAMAEAHGATDAEDAEQARFGHQGLLRRLVTGKLEDQPVAHINGNAVPPSCQKGEFRLRKLRK